jgi:hypothetical protein
MELIIGAMSAGGGFLMKMKAQREAYNFQLMQTALQAKQQADKAADTAAKRSSPWLRKMVGLIVIGVAFIGTLYVATKGIPVSYIYDSTTKEVLWGLFKWGGEPKVLTAFGFVWAEWFRYSVISVVHFLFGTGAAKVTMR